VVPCFSSSFGTVWSYAFWGGFFFLLVVDIY
jgi:hypothetical protein